MTSATFSAMAHPGFKSQIHVTMALSSWLTASLIGFAALAAPAESVNYDDPNLVYTNEFAGDAATSCPGDPLSKEFALCMRGHALGGATTEDTLDAGTRSGQEVARDAGAASGSLSVSRPTR